MQYIYTYTYIKLPRWLSGKNLPANEGEAEDVFDSWVGKIPLTRKWQPTPVFLPEKSLGQRSLAGTVHGVAKSQT